MFHKIKFLLAVFAAAVTFSACSDDPTSLGNAFLTGDMVGLTKVNSDTLKQTSSVFQKDISLGLSSRLMLGKYKGTESSVLMRFDLTSLADSIKTGIKNGTMSVEFAKVVMRRSYILGDKSAAFGFGVHNVTTAWTNGVTKDSLGSLGYSSKDIASAKTDTGNIYSFMLDKETIKGWVDGTNYGIYLKPDPGCQKIVGFNALNVSLESTQYTQFILAIRNSKNVVDTLGAISPYYDAHIPQIAVPARNNSNIYVMGSYALNSKLRFDLSSFPKNAMAMNSVLQLNADSLACQIGSPGNDTIAVRFLYSSSEISYDTSNVLFLQRQGNKFVGDMTSFIQRWLQNETNNGVLLSLGSESATLDFLSFYGSTAEADKRPKLTIFYSFKK